MIRIKDLTPDDVGKWVVYNSFNSKELGRIKSWNDQFIFVVYKCDGQWLNFTNYTACATKPEDLEMSV